MGAAALWGRNGGGIGNILGGSGSCGGGNGTSPTNININGGDTSYSGGGHVAPTAFETFEKGCEEALALTSAIYQGQIAGLKEASAARNLDIDRKSVV